MKVSEILKEVTIDNEKGWGSVPYNRNVDYLGLRVQMKPSIFLSLACKLGGEINDALRQHMKSGGAIGSPFLEIVLPEEWMSGDLTKPAVVRGHEGRNRMTLLLRNEGDTPIEVHLFFPQYRRRHLTPEMIQELNTKLIPERMSIPIKGPFFTI